MNIFVNIFSKIFKWNLNLLAVSFLAYLLLLPSTVFSAQAPDSLNRAMSDIGEIMVDIYPLIVAKRALTDKEVQKISHSLTNLSGLFQYTGPFIKKKSDTYNTSYQLILDYLAETSRAMQSKNIKYARSRLYALGTICASCHTQDTKLRTLFSGTQRQQFTDDYDYAEFNFTTRNYEQAMQEYDKHLLSTQTKTELEIARPLQRIITIYAQIYNRPGDGASKLETYLTLKQHTQTTKENLKAWINGLNDLEQMGVSGISNIDLSTLKQYVKKFLGPLNKPVVDLNLEPKEEVYLVWLRGQLYHYLNRNPARDEIPKLLYWLAISDRGIGYNFYFSLADLYLKQCIMEFSSHPFAKFCYKEYKEYVYYSYTGSGGMFLPPETEEELEDLKAMLKKKN